MAKVLELIIATKHAGTWNYGPFKIPFDEVKLSNLGYGYYPRPCKNCLNPIMPAHGVWYHAAKWDRFNNGDWRWQPVTEKYFSYNCIGAKP